MGLFKHNNSVSEKTYEENGFIIGIDSHIIYHIPKTQTGGSLFFPNGTTGLTKQSIMEMRSLNPQQVVVPGSFKKFNIQFMNMENLNSIVLQEGVEEVKCSFSMCKNAVDVKLPTTIKRIGTNNYPIVQHLVLPKGTIEIGTLFASHDTNLLSVNIPGTIKTIPSGAFNQCKNLQSVIFNDGVETSNRDIFRGTNNLCNLEIPSTYNGVIDLPMENRPGSNLRGNSKYDGTRFDEEQNSILKVKIKRENKLFEFNIRRGDRPNIEIRQNKIQIKCNSLITSIDCNVLQQGTYSIENGNIKMQQSATSPQKQTITSTHQTTNQQSKQEEVDEKLDIIFQHAYRENITKRDDFKGLSFPVKMQIKKAMRESFVQNAKQFGSLNTSSENFDYLYRETLNTVSFEETVSPSSENLNNGGIKR